MDIQQPNPMDVLDDAHACGRNVEEDHGRLISSRPQSASGAWTGGAGVFAAVAGTVLLRGWTEIAYVKVLAVLALAAAVMLAMDIFVYRVQRNPTTELAWQPVRPLNLFRLFQKLAGFWLTLGVIAAFYALLPEYGDAFYQPFWDAAFYLLPGVVVASPFYIAYVDCRLRDPVDAYVQLALLFAGRKPAGWGALALHARSWLVKAFFTPLMFVYVHNGLNAMWSAPLLPVSDFQHIFSRLIDLFYLIDVLLAAIAYTLTLRVIDTHIRSVEPTIGGWVICVICYRPLTDAQAPYIQYELDKLYWGEVFSPYPWLYVVWGSLILMLVFIYAWSTAIFGLRFSNLTNRGIITSGPYRWVRHPAYLAKNLSWWLISVPFVAGAGWPIAVQSCLMLCAGNLIYYLRARTEERHLSADPAYRAYTSYIAEHGLMARLIGKVRLRRLCLN